MTFFHLHSWGGTPAIAIFASNHRYKRESYRGSNFAPRVLADNEIPVVLKVGLSGSVLVRLVFMHPFSRTILFSTAAT